MDKSRHHLRRWTESNYELNSSNGVTDVLTRSVTEVLTAPCAQRMLNATEPGKRSRWTPDFQRQSYYKR
jgi:hypothetical protein